MYSSLVARLNALKSKADSCPVEELLSIAEEALDLAGEAMDALKPAPDFAFVGDEGIK